MTALAPALLALAALAGDAEDWSHHTGEIPFVVGSEAGRAAAAEQGKPLMLYVTGKSCTTCKRMAAESFGEAEVVEALEPFVPVLVDGDAEGEVVLEYGVHAYPEFRFETAAGAPLAAHSGYATTAQFLEVVASATRALAEDPAPVHEAFFATPQEATGLAVGDAVPDVTVRTVDGEAVDLREELGGRPTVLLFYRGGWCPFCNAHLSRVAEIVDDLDALGVRVVAISPDLPAEARATAEEAGLGYTLLADPGQVATRAFRLAFELDEATIERYRGFGLDLSAQGWALPVPAAFVVDAEGTIAFAHVDPDYEQRIENDELLEAARRVTAGSRSSR